MKTVVLTDRPICLSENEDRVIYHVDELAINDCTGCLDCQFRTPGICVFDDVMKEINRAIRTCDELIIVSEVCFGTYAPAMSAAIGRTRVQEKPFYKKADDHVQHLMRGVRKKLATIVGYGVESGEESELFKDFARSTVYRFNITELRVFGTSPDRVNECLLLGEGLEEEDDDE